MLLSVVVPVYNTEPYLKQCIDSILAQRVSDMEIILVDDGSTDGSGAICDEYAQKHNKVKVIHKENSGVQDARLLGVESALGRYIAFVDSDDWIKDTMYEELLALICETGADMADSGILRYYSAEHQVEDIRSLEGYYNQSEIKEKVIPYMMFGRGGSESALLPSLCTKIFKKERILKFLRKANVIKIHFSDDCATIYPMVLELDSMIVTKKSYYFHRQRPIGCVPSYVADSNFHDKLYKLYNYFRECFSKDEQWDILQEQLDYYMMCATQFRRMCYEPVGIDRQIVHIFPFENVLPEHQVILYGAGAVGKAYKKQNEQYRFCNIVAWVDKKYKEYPSEMEIASPQKICEMVYDYIIIAVAKRMFVKEIMDDLIELGVPKEKIIWENIEAEKLVCV